ncbi:MAG: hypothetical protein AB7E55_16775 [Pigmentiphaga sp.]
MSDQPQCPHCHSSMTHLHALIERLETTVVQTVRCTLCGWRVSRAIQPPRLQNIGGLVAKKTGRPAGKTGSVACSVVGCTHRPTAGAYLGMCASHRKTLKQWQESKKTFSCPFEELPDGGYALLTKAQRRKHGRT